MDITLFVWVISHHISVVTVMGSCADVMHSHSTISKLPLIYLFILFRYLSSTEIGSVIISDDGGVCDWALHLHAPPDLQSTSGSYLIV